METENITSPDGLDVADLSVSLTEGLNETAVTDSSLTLAFHWLSDNGGPVALILVLVSLFAVVIILLKIWQLRQIGSKQVKEVEVALKRWRQNEPKAALLVLAKSNIPISEIVHLAMRGIDDRRYSAELLKEELNRVAMSKLESLREHLRTLEIIGTLSPLLGLLGTVLGMIEAFRQLESVGSQVDPAVLSGGIWQALLTTALGLIVAIPVVAAFTWFDRKVESYSIYINDAVTRVFTIAGHRVG